MKGGGRGVGPGGGTVWRRTPSRRGQHPLSTFSVPCPPANAVLTSQKERYSIFCGLLLDGGDSTKERLHVAAKCLEQVYCLRVCAANVKGQCTRMGGKLRD